MNFNWLKKALEENAQELAKKGKKALEAGMSEAKKNFDTNAVELFVQNLYATLDNPQIANKLSDLVRSIDGEKINKSLQKITAPFTTEEGSIQLARILKQLQQTGQLDSMLEKLTDGTDKLGSVQKFAIKFIMSGLEPVLQNVDALDEEELAQEIRDSFSDLPTNDLSDMIEGLGRNITPETIGMLKHQATSKLPTPKALAAIFNEILESGIDNLSNSKKTNYDFKQDIGKIIQDNLQQDKDDKKKFGNKGPGRK